MRKKIKNFRPKIGKCDALYFCLLTTLIAKWTVQFSLAVFTILHIPRYASNVRIYLHSLLGFYGFRNRLQCSFVLGPILFPSK